MGEVMGDYSSPPIDEYPEKLVEYDGSNRKIYEGAGLPSSVKTNKAWRITKYTYDGDNVIKDILNPYPAPLIRWEDRIDIPIPTISFTPVIKLQKSMIEQTTIQGTITNYVAGTTYDITASIGTISNISGGTFDYTAPNVIRRVKVILTIIGTNPGQIPSGKSIVKILIKEFRILDRIRLDFPLEVIKNTTTNVKIINMIPNQTYDITCTEGAIVYTSGDTFEYIAPEVNEDTLDTIFIISHKDEFEDITLNINFTILDKYVRTTQKPNIVFPLEVDETSVTEGNILGWKAANTYDIIENNGTISPIVDGIFTFTANIVGVNTVTSMSIQATAPNMNPSGYTEKAFMIVNTTQGTPTPTLNISSNIEEQFVEQGVITNYVVGETYVITALHGTISNIVANTFNYTAPVVAEDTLDIITIIGTIPGYPESEASSNNIIIINKITITPTLSIANLIDEAVTEQGVITNHVAGTTYTISATLGTISNISAGTFDYTTPVVTTVTIDTISIIAHVVNDEDSIQLDTGIIIDNSITATPILSITSNILEETTTQGTITNHVAGTTYSITTPHGTITNINGGIFDYTADEISEETVDTISIIGTAPGDEASDQLDIGITIDNRITPTPVVSIASNILEETIEQGTITNHVVGTTYTITATLSTISNISGDTFDYTASEVSEETVDIISIIAHVTGDEDSIQSDTGITIDNRITIIPTLGIASNIIEAITIQGVISNHTVGTTYTISAILGTISNAANDIFDYTAPEVIEETIDIISIIAHVIGDEDSIQLDTNITIDNTVTTTPILDIASNVIEETLITGTITNHAVGTTYTISATLGTISNISNATFDYTAPVISEEIIDTISIIGTAPRDETSDQLDTNITIDNRITSTPVLSIASNITEETTEQGTITNHTAGTTYTITATLGTISNIANATFDYTVSEVTTDTPDTINITAHVVGDEDSLQLDHDITIDNRITTTPVLSIATNITEASLVTGVITNYVVGTTYTISATLGTISNISNDTFDYTAPAVGSDYLDTISIIAYVTGDEDSLQLNHDIIIDNRITTTPTLSISTNILEETMVQGTITNYVVGTTYTITATLGTISNIANDIFDYTASEVTTDTPDTISIIAHVVGDEDSLQLNHGITIDNRIAPTPTLNISSNITEETTEQGVISNHVAGTTYNITADNGTISNESGGTFDYTAPNCGLFGGSDVISIIATAPGDEPSAQLDTDMDITYF